MKATVQKDPTLTSSQSNDRQVGGQHYRAGAGECPHCHVQLQHWDVVAAFGLDYFIGNATKYLFRLGRKNDDVEELEKALHYLQKRLEIAQTQKDPTRRSA